jgi:hypothetical protein
MTTAAWAQLRWRLDRAWSTGSLPTVCLAASAALCMGVFAAATVIGAERREAQRALHVDLDRARAAVVPTAPASAPNAPRDFVATLGPPLPATVVIQELQRASAAAGVLLAGVQAQPRDAEPGQLGRTELQVTLRGPYPGTKLVLKQVVERFPQLTVQRLRLRRAQSPADVETSVTLSAWSAPAASAGR